MTAHQETWDSTVELVGHTIAWGAGGGGSYTAGAVVITEVDLQPQHGVIRNMNEMFAYLSKDEKESG